MIEVDLSFHLSPSRPAHDQRGPRYQGVAPKSATTPEISPLFFERFPLFGFFHAFEKFEDESELNDYHAYEELGLSAEFFFFFLFWQILVVHPVAVTTYSSKL